MVDIAKQAIRSSNYRLATEVYERIIKEKGPAKELYIELANCLAQSGRISESFGAFLKAFRLGAVQPEDLNKLSSALVRFTRERMESLSYNGEQTTALIIDHKYLLDNEPFFCGLCLGTTQEPITMLCGHTFCKKCLAKLDSNTCVACGPNPIVGSIKPNILLSGLTCKLFPKLEQLNNLKAEANKACSNGDFADALTIYDTILKDAPLDHIVWSNRSYANYRLENFAEALKDAKQIVRCRPQWAKGYYRKGLAEEALKKTQEAAISYMKCMALDGQAHQAHDNLNQILHNLLKPSIMVENLKHIPSSSHEPMSHLLSSTDSDLQIKEAMDKVRALLDDQFHQCNTALEFSAELSKVDHSDITTDMFECSLCYRLLHQPVTTPCGHVFCRGCLNRSLDHNVDCPQCRSSLAMYLVQRQRPVTAAIQRLLQVWFPNELMERERQNLDDMSVFSTTGKTAEIPIFVCSMAYPMIPCPLHVFEPRYRLMMRQVMESGVRQFGMVYCSGEDENGYADFGTMLEITDIKFFDDGRSVVDTVGGRRFKVLERGQKDGYHTAKVKFLDEAIPADETVLRELQSLYDSTYDKASRWLSNLPRRYLAKIAQQFGNLPEKDVDIKTCRLGPKWVWWLIAILPVDPRAQLTFLSMNSLKDRLGAIDRVLTYINQRQA